jgi:hypothetical protein
VHITITGAVLVPIILAVFLLTPSRLEELLIFMAIFEGAAVLNVGGGAGFGLSPFFFVAALLATRTIIKWYNNKILFQRGEFAQDHLRIAAIFTGWCVVSAFLLPVLFRGTPVDSPRAGAEAVFYLALPLKWTFSNAGQAGYMVLDFLALLALSDFCAKRPVERLVNAYTCSGAMVVLVGMYQMLCNRFGLSFPTAFFNSNTSWGQATAQIIGPGIHRVSATFVEPSAAGGFLSSWLVFEFILAYLGLNRRTYHWLLAIVGSLILLATASTTGYITLLAMLGFLFLRLAMEAVGRGRILVRVAIIVVVVLGVTAGYLIMSHGGTSLLDAVLWQKSSSTSATVRKATVWRALAIMQDTYGLGVGLGSNRSFGTLAYIGSNLGIFGLVLFIYMLVHLTKGAISCLQYSASQLQNRAALVACIGALLAHLLGIMLSGAEISDPELWVAWGMVLASARYCKRLVLPRPATRLSRVIYKFA